MAVEKKPSIYDDRGAIGSSSELDEYGVWVKSGPQDLSGGGEADDAAFDAAAEAAAPAGDDFSIPLPDLEGDAGGDGVSPEPFDLDGFEAEALDPDFSGADLGGEDLPAAEPEEGGLELPESGEAEEFSEVSLNDFLGDPEEPGPSGEGPEETAAPAAPVSAGADLSTQLLMKIADELASIRTELSTLKGEFSVIRGGGQAAVEEEAPVRGFFDEEDDEKIALTGDELNNIIQTADFTEETGTGVQADAPADEPVSGPFEETVVEFPPEAEPAGLDLDDGDLLKLREEGAGPLTPAPEDTSYLDESPLAEAGDFDGLSLEEFDEKAFDLSGTEGETGETPPKELSLEGIEDISGEITLGEISEETSLEETSLEEPSPEAEPVEETALEEFSLEDSASLDLPALEDIPLDDAAAEAAAGDPSLDIVLEEDDGAAALSPDEGPGAADGPADEPAEDLIELSLDDFLGNPQDPPPEGEASGSEEDPAGEDLIPEGFVVEADDAPLFIEDAGEGLEAAGPPPEEGEKTGEETPEKKPSQAAAGGKELPGISPALTEELRTVLSYMDHLLESLPEEKIEEFARSEYFDSYKKLFKELGIG